MGGKEKEYFIKAGFSQEQIDEIEQGQDAGVATSVYAMKKFEALQMYQIRMGLQAGLSVEIYAKADYDAFQMEEIRKGLVEGLDVKVYASRKIGHEQMHQIREGLKQGVDVSDYQNADAMILRQLRLARAEEINIEKYIHAGYDAQQLEEIRRALEEDIDIEPYLLKEYRGVSIAQIAKGLKEGIDVSIYARDCYNWRQMREIRKGIENQIDVNSYIDPLYDWRQMREIRHGLQMGLDVSGYKKLRYTAAEMRKRRKEIFTSNPQFQWEFQINQVTTEDFVVEISTNAMEAYITVLATNKIITRKALLEVLEQFGIRRGILEDTIKKLVDGRYGKRPMQIARGRIPYQGDDGWYEFFFRTDVVKKPKELEDGSVDYQDVEWFETVKKGQKLAYYHEAQEGTDGYTVNGDVIKAKKGKEKSILIGTGFSIAPDKKTYISTMSGMVTLNGNQLEVTRHLVLDEVSMVTGNIRFDGSIHIRGNVENGIRVSAADDLVIDGTVGAATIVSDGSILIKKGMNSAGHGLVKAKKNVECKFLESATVEAGGDIRVSQCLHSKLYAQGKIYSTSTIIGGTACAEGGYRLYNAGNQAGVHTSIRVGYNEETKNAYMKIRDGMRETEQELQFLNNSHDKLVQRYEPSVRNSLDVFIKLENAIYTKKKQMEELTAQYEEYRKRLREAEVVISGCAYEGTVVDLNGRKWLANNQKNITVATTENKLMVYVNKD